MLPTVLRAPQPQKHAHPKGIQGQTETWTHVLMPEELQLGPADVFLGNTVNVCKYQLSAIKHVHQVNCLGRDPGSAHRSTATNPRSTRAVSCRPERSPRQSHDF